MSWGEVWRLTMVLAADPSSQLAAALNGWAHPVSRDFMALADLYDAFVAANTKKGRKSKPYPRPWLDDGRKRFGKATRPQHEIRAALAARGHGQVATKRQPRDKRGRFVSVNSAEIG